MGMMRQLVAQVPRARDSEGKGNHSSQDLERRISRGGSQRTQNIAEEPGGRDWGRTRGVRREPKAPVRTLRAAGAAGGGVAGGAYPFTFCRVPVNGPYHLKVDNYEGFQIQLSGAFLLLFRLLLFVFLSLCCLARLGVGGLDKVQPYSRGSTLGSECTVSALSGGLG